MPKLGMINYAGASEGRVAPIMAEKIKENKGQSLIVVPTLNRAKRSQSAHPTESMQEESDSGSFFP